MGRKAKQVQAGDEEDKYVDLTPKQYLAMINFVKKTHHCGTRNWPTITTTFSQANCTRKWGE